jgi:hypothetical protein
LITETGVELLSRFPFEEALLAQDWQSRWSMKGRYSNGSFRHGTVPAPEPIPSTIEEKT